MEFCSDWNDLLCLFLKHKVNFLIVGGHAVAAHGYSRYTENLDIFVDCSESNAHKILLAFEEFYGSSAYIKKEQLVKPNKVLFVGNKPFRVDILTGIDGLAFQASFANSVKYIVGDHLVPVIALNDLITNKRASGRAKDLLDIEELKKITKR